VLLVEDAEAPSLRPLVHTTLVGIPPSLPGVAEGAIPPSSAARPPTGGWPGDIIKRGNTHLRTPFIHGVRAAVPSLPKSPSPLGEWLLGLLARTHRNIALMALANKLARIAWETLRRQQSFNLGHAAVAC
jgi:hypothetical protein